VAEVVEGSSDAIDGLGSRSGAIVVRVSPAAVLDELDRARKLSPRPPAQVRDQHKQEGRAPPRVRRAAQGQQPCGRMTV
jgi:hypothetical protein